jgi:hypothetical protein
MVVPARVQVIEVAAAVDPEQQGLAIKDEGGIAVAQGGLRDQRESTAPVVAVSGPETRKPRTALPVFSLKLGGDDGKHEQDQARRGRPLRP